MMDSRTFRPHGSGGSERKALRGSCEHLFRRYGLKLAFPGTSDTYLTSIGRSSPSRCLSALTLQVKQWHRSFCENEGRTRLEGPVRPEAGLCWRPRTNIGQASNLAPCIRASLRSKVCRGREFARSAALSIIRSEKPTPPWR